MSKHKFVMILLMVMLTMVLAGCADSQNTSEPADASVVLLTDPGLASTEYEEQSRKAREIWLSEQLLTYRDIRIGETTLEELLAREDQLEIGRASCRERVYVLV